MNEPILRPGERADLSGISAVYDHFVRETATTFDLEPPSVHARRRWFRTFDVRGPYRLWVAESADGIIGYASSKPYNPRGAYTTSAEVSIYLSHRWLGHGLGTRLYARLFDSIRDEGLHRMYAAIAVPNEPSEALHRKFGFHEIGLMSEVGRKFGRYWDVRWFEKTMDG